MAEAEKRFDSGGLPFTSLGNAAFGNAVSAAGVACLQGCQLRCARIFRLVRRLLRRIGGSGVATSSAFGNSTTHGGAGGNNSCSGSIVAAVSSPAYGSGRSSKGRVHLYWLLAWLMWGVTVALVDRRRFENLNLWLLGPRTEAAWVLGGAITLVTLPLALYLSAEHLLHFVEPQLQVT